MRFQHILGILLTTALTALCVGCAPLFGSAFEAGSTLLSLGSLGQTAVQLIDVNSGNAKISVGWLPQQYAGNHERMLRETWEQNYQLIKTSRWEGEDLSQREVAAAVARRTTAPGKILAMVQKTPLPAIAAQEEVTVYATPAGKVLATPAEAPGLSYYPQMRLQEVAIARYAYTAHFFVKNKQPSGLLAMEGPWNGACRTPYGYGSLIRAVGRKTPAANAGLQAEDVIVAVNGRDAEYHALFALLQPGENKLTVCRNGRHGEHVLIMPGGARSPKNATSPPRPR